MKNVLLLAIYFPPRNQIASYRTGCFAKYLPENGWMPTVVCEDWAPGNGIYDPDCVGVIPSEVQVIRIPNPRPKGFYQKVFLRKLLPYVFPHRSPHIWWQETRRQVFSLLASGRFDAIWATSDPLTPLGLAAEASVRFRLPWIADIRDSYNVQPFGSWYKRPIWAFHERRLCRLAQRVFTVSPGLAEGLTVATGRKVEVMENGFDPEMFGPAVTTHPKFTIVYTGALLPERNPQPLFEAMARCVEQGLIPRSEIEVVFYGPPLKQLQPLIPSIAGGFPLRQYDRISHQEITSMQQNSTVLLMLAHAHEKGVLTGKIFDYLGAGRPILSIPDDHGDVTALLKRTGAGITASTVEEIMQVLVRWYNQWKTTGRIEITGNPDEIQYYSRKNQARRLAGILDEICATPVA